MYHQAAIREMKEEIQLTAPLEFVATGVREDAGTRGSKGHIFKLYKTIAPDGWEFASNGEVKELLLMSIEDIKRDNGFASRQLHSWLCANA